MKIGALTTRFIPDQWPLERIISWAGKTGIECLEIDHRHLDLTALLESRPRQALLDLLAASKVSISALSYYRLDMTSADLALRAEALRTIGRLIELAEALGVGVVCTLAGLPIAGKSKLDTINQDLPGVFGPLIEAAAKKGIKLALENYFATNIQHLDHWQALFKVLPQENFGLNFDPSHLDRMEIDYLAAIIEFKARIFHTHAKDTIVDMARRRRIGVLECQDSRFAIPGTGRIAWGPYLHTLRSITYDGVLSLEHEDPTLSAVDGFRIGAAHLRQFVA
jgi:sugar phosphate isomerase/epimerase